MRKLFSGLIHSKAMLASLLVLVGVVVTASLLKAWGPERRTFTIQKPANYVTFNSITNSPVGDERNFVRIKEVGQPDSAYTDKMKLVPGKEYEVYTFFHNNAAANLNKVAQNTRMRVYAPHILKAGQTTSINSEISASNANPNKVYDDVKVSTDSDMALRYVQGSAKLTTRFVKNVQLPDEIFKSGTPIGTYGRDGRVPGCNEFSGYVTYRFKVVQPNFTVRKEVRLQGQKTWSKDLKVKAGDILEYRVVYRNTGMINQSNVHIRDALPKGLSYVSGSAEINNAALAHYTKLTKQADDYFKQHGWVNLGNYAPNANAILRYKLKVEDADQMNCGYNSYINIASAVTENGTKQDRVKVTAHKHCEQVKKIQVCELKTKKIVTINEPEFNSTLHSKNLDDCKEQPKAKEIQVCELKTKKIVTIKEAEFNSTLHSKNLDDCKEQPKANNIQVCELKTKKIVTIKESEFNSALHSKNFDDCKEVPPVTPPTTPPSLPKTGLDTVASVFGLIALVGSVGYYVNSRKL